jgi:hypothetical protein
MKNKHRLYGTTEMSKILGISRVSLSELCERKKIAKVKNSYRLSIDLWKSILLKKHRKKLYKIEPKEKSKPTPEVIYVTRTTEILHSKLNFLTLEQL